jgi:hypothetical protein
VVDYEGGGRRKARRVREFLDSICAILAGRSGGSRGLAKVLKGKVPRG